MEAPHTPIPTEQRIHPLRLISIRKEEDHSTPHGALRLVSHTTDALWSLTSDETIKSFPSLGSDLLDILPTRTNSGALLWALPGLRLFT